MTSTEAPSLVEAARRLRGELQGDQIVAPGPNHSERDRSLSIRFSPDAPEGFLVYSFAGDDPFVCRDHVRQRLGLHPWRVKAKRAAKIQSLPPDDKELTRSVLARRIWLETQEPGGTLVELYLTSRGLTLGPELASVLRFHSRLGLDNGRSPGMVALLRDIHTNEPCGIHRTFLDQDGRKIGRKMLGRARAAAVKLDADADVTSGLTVGEGIETCLAARALGYRPTWALGSAGAIAALVALPGIEALNILAEHDDGGANARAAQICAGAWTAAGSEVWLHDPQVGDFNDLIKAPHDDH